MRLNKAVLWFRKTEVPCYSRRGTIKTPPCSKVTRAKQRPSTFCSPQPAWWRSLKDEIFLSGRLKICTISHNRVINTDFIKHSKKLKKLYFLKGLVSQGKLEPTDVGDRMFFLIHIKAVWAVIINIWYTFLWLWSQTVHRSNFRGWTLWIVFYERRIIKIIFN